VFDAMPKKIAAYPTPTVTTSGTVDERARSYLQANCSICHRPGGALSDIDLRFPSTAQGATFQATGLCGQVEKGTGVTPPVRLVPGDPSSSALSFRMHDTGPSRMPKIGSLVVDPDGTKLVDDWIKAIPRAACP
jgi:hypothetical protein